MQSKLFKQFKQLIFFVNFSSDQPAEVVVLHHSRHLGRKEAKGRRPSGQDRPRLRRRPLKERRQRF